MRKFNSKYSRYPVKTKTLEYKPATQTPFAENETLKRIQRESQERAIREERERNQARIIDFINRIHEDKPIQYGLFYFSYSDKHQFEKQAKDKFPGLVLDSQSVWWEPGVDYHSLAYINAQSAPAFRRWLVANGWMGIEFGEAFRHEMAKTSKEYALKRLKYLKKIVYQTRKEYPNACPDFDMNKIIELIKKYDEKR